MAVGAAIIFYAKFRLTAKHMVVAGLLAWAVLTLFHLFVHGQILETGFFGYVKDSYLLGIGGRTGGGALGAVLAFLTMKLFGTAGSYIFAVTAILVCIVALTHFSVRKKGQEVGERIAQSVKDQKEKRQQRREEKELYVADLEPGSLPKKDKLGIDPLTEKGPIPMVKRPRYPGDVELGDPPFEPDEPIKVYGENDPLEVEEAFIERAQALKGVGGKAKRREAPKPSFFEEEQPKNPSVSDFDENEPPRPRSAPEAGGPESAPEKREPAYTRPPVDLLRLPPKAGGQTEDVREKAKILKETLASFGISAKVLQVNRGPVITRYELQPAPGIKVSRILNLSDDIALSMAAPGVRIEAPIPGKAAIGIEVPNQKSAMVSLREVLDSKTFWNHPSKLAVALGKDIAGTDLVIDLAKMPHLLIAGATGSGKSVCINSILLSILYKADPAEVKLIVVDPKVVELGNYNGIPHLMIPVVTDPKKAAGALKWAVVEMEKRYRTFADARVKNITQYNEMMAEAGEEKMPFIVVIIDELADLMMVAAKDVEENICRLAQLARAAGIHLVVATQRPSANVITGLIKANIPSRIAFAVSSMIDSRIILDAPGAEKLLGRGDMLYFPMGASKPTRAQGCFVSEDETNGVADYIRERMGVAEYSEEVQSGIEAAAGGSEESPAGGEDYDELLPLAVKTALEYGQASASMFQRRLRVGYSRASRLIDEMEQRGIVSAFEGSKSRNVLITREDYERMFPGEGGLL
nr:DNA translocase FtsK [Gehongia tenuis]